MKYRSVSASSVPPFRSLATVLSTLALILSCLPRGAHAATNYVAWDAAGAGNGSSWGDAYTNIQDAINASTDGDSIYVKQGTYNLAAQLTIGAGTNLTVRGGYVGSGTPGAHSGNPGLTVLSGPGTSGPWFRVFDINSADCWIEGLTVANGYLGNNNPHQHGGGIQLTSSSTVFTNCIIRDNQVVGWADKAGGVYATGGSPVFERCQIYDNFNSGSYSAGGAGLFSGSSVTFRDCVIKENEHATDGGLRFDGSGTVRLQNCLIARNAGSHGLYCNGPNVVIESCTVSGHADISVRRNSGSVTVTNSILWGNGDDLDGTIATLVDSCVRDADTGPGVIHDDPQFEYGFYLSSGSPCIDANTNATAASIGLAGKYTETGASDTGNADFGYHYDSGYAISAPDLYVDAAATDDSGAGTIGDPFKTLTNALAQAEVGARVHVAAGTYNQASGEMFPLMVTTEAIQILGADPETTIIDADAQDRVMIVRGVGTGGLISGITLTDGRGGDVNGCGLSLQLSSVTVSNCIIRNNSKGSQGERGGGLHAHAGLPTIVKCIIRNNTMPSNYTGGGGVGAFRSVLTMRDCVIDGNSANSAAGLYLEGYACTMRDCLVISNSSDSANNYDGLRLGSGTLLIENCTFADNADRGIYRSGGTMTVSNSIVWGHTVDNTVGVDSNAIWFCRVDAEDNAPGHGNVTGDPLFVNGYYLSHDDWAGLQGTDSPCVDAGGITAAAAGVDHLTTRTDGLPDEGAVDMGYHYETALPVNAPYIRFLPGASVTEGDTPSQTTLVFTVTLSRANTYSVSAEYGTSNGAATASADYLSTNGVLTVSAGNTTGTFEVVVVGDDELEGDHDFYAILSNAVNGVITNDIGTGTIEDDEGGATLAVSDASVTEGVSPDTTNLAFEVTLSQVAGGAVTVEFETEDGSAVSSGGYADYAATNGSLTFTVGETSKTVVVVVNGDDLWEGSDEALSLNLTNAVGAVINDPEGIGTIIEDDPAPTAWYVAPDGDDSLGQTWGTAFTNIHYAVANASPGHALYIKQGAYTITNEIVLAKVLTLRGGYAGSGLPGARSLDPASTTFQRPAGAPARNRLLRIDSVDCVLDTLTFADGYLGNSDPHEHGGGVKVTDSSSLFTNCVIRDNSVIGWADQAGGLYVQGGVLGGSPTFVDCTFSGNYNAGSYSAGGAGVVNGSSALFRGCVVRENTQPSQGGFYLLGGGTVLFENCLVVRNAGSRAIQGNGPNVVLRSCTIADSPYTAVSRSAGTVTVTNSVLWYNGNDLEGTVTLVDSCTEDPDTGTRVTHEDPLLECGYYLAGGSPCIDADTNTTAAGAGVSTRYAQKDATDGGDLDYGYHYPAGYTLTAPDLYVDASSPDDDGTGAAGSPFKTLTNAFANAQAGTRIHVAPGTYNAANGDVFPLSMELESMQLLGDDPATTILDAGNVVGKRVLTVQGAGSGGLIAGLTFTGGNSGTAKGGGIYVDFSGLTVSNCVVRNNTANETNNRGAGIYVNRSNGELISCTVQSNVLSGNHPYGGGISVESSTLDMRDCVISENSVSRGGGGIYHAGHGTLLNCLVVSNQCADAAKGDGLHMSGAAVSLVNCSVVDNGGIGLYGDAALTNCIFWGNGDDLSSVDTAAVAFCCIEDGDADGVNGNFSTDPLFVGGYYLSHAAIEGSDSPCVNAGTNVTATAPFFVWPPEYTTRTDGGPEAAGSDVDVGYHYPSDWTPPAGTMFLLR